VSVIVGWVGIECVGEGVKVLGWEYLSTSHGDKGDGLLMLGYGIVGGIGEVVEGQTNLIGGVVEVGYGEDQGHLILSNGELEIRYGYIGAIIVIGIEDW